MAICKNNHRFKIKCACQLKKKNKTKTLKHGLNNRVDADEELVNWKIKPKTISGCHPECLSGKYERE